MVGLLYLSIQVQGSQVLELLDPVLLWEQSHLTSFLVLKVASVHELDISYAQGIQVVLHTVAHIVRSGTDLLDVLPHI